MSDVVGREKKLREQNRPGLSCWFGFGIILPNASLAIPIRLYKLIRQLEQEEKKKRKLKQISQRKIIRLSSSFFPDLKPRLLSLALPPFPPVVGSCSTLINMSLFGLGSRNQKTFRPKKNAPSGTKGAQLQKHIDATLGSGNLREAVKLPPGEDLYEWLAVNTVDFFNQVNILYGTLTEFCTPNTCPTMSAGAKYEYRWADGVNIKKPIEVSAPKYVEYLMDWIETQLDDESIFPQKLGAPFPSNFQDVVKTIFKRLFRVYAHIYHSHFSKIVSLKEEAHMNTCFKHFVLFTWEFRLIDKGELAPLQDIVESILQC